MPQLLIVIFDETTYIPELLAAWQSIGVPGITIINAAGGYRAAKQLSQPKWFRRTIGDLLKLDELQSKILMTVIDDEEILARAIAEAERIVGDFNRPNTGLLFTLPITHVTGLVTPENLETVIPLPRPSDVMFETELPRNVPVSAVKDILNLEPIVVQAGQSLLDIVQAMVEKPNVDVACVVNDQQRLVGLLPLPSLADDLFLMIVPEEFFRESVDEEGVLRYAKLTGTHTVGDAMIPAVWVKDNDTVKDAFLKMHEHKLTGVPVVNDIYEITGYINLLELLAIYARSQKTSES